MTNRNFSDSPITIIGSIIIILPSERCIVSAAPAVAVIDIGSTRIRYGPATREGPVAVETERTEPMALTTQVVDIVDRLRTQFAGTIRHVSVSTTGLVDSAQGVIKEFDTVDGETIHEIPIASAMTDAFGLPTTVENDCTAATIGEDVFGAGHQFDTVVHVTFGTGIGGGVVTDGSPIRGEQGYAAEVGLIPIVADGDVSSTGVRGAWEAYCSGRGIPQFTRHRLATDDRSSTLRSTENLSAADVFAAADAGDAFAQSILERLAQYNAAGIGAIANTYNPGIITLGGSVALQNPDWILDGIHRHLDDYVLADPPTIQLTSLGEDIELYGGAAAFFGAKQSAPVMEQRND